MPRKVSLVGAAALAMVLAALLGAPAAAQQAPRIPDTSARVDDLLRRGHQLEMESRWGDAFSHYEEAVHSFPGERSLQRRYELARLHYDLGRRYADRSFTDALGGMSENQALDLYSEVLLKIQTHYVEAPDWKGLVERGTNNLEVALAEPAFVRQNAPGVDAKSLVEFRQEVRRLLGPRPVGSRAAARDAVRLAADDARQRLGIKPVAVVLEYLCGATSSLDPYSAYLTPDQLDEVYSQIEGNFVGLGIELKAADGALLIVRVIPRSPAQESGVLAGDRILAIDGKSTRDLTTDGAANLLQGPSGSVVRLSLGAAGQPTREVEVRRRRIDVPSVDDVHIADAEYGVGYMKLTCFQRTTSRDVDAALWELHRAGMKSLIIDVRGNPGGLLTAAVEVVDKFVERGVIVSTRGRSLQEDFTYSAHAPGTWRVPLVVLIDHDSASAAEIFAGAIRDHRRGTIVGERSYGKGSVQGIFPLSSSNAGVRLTTAKFYSPAGRPFCGVGVKPDTLVHQVAKPTTETGTVPPKAESDVVLAAAVQAARQSIGRR